MTLPLLISVPHAGLTVPPEVQPHLALTPADILKASDEHAAQIYDVRSHVAAFVDTDIACAVVDLNRSPDDRRPDGVIKTHTCYNVLVYREPLPTDLADTLLARYYHPYHRHLTQLASGARLGIDCHTMAAVGPPISPDPGRTRPDICVSNAEGQTCPNEWLDLFAQCLQCAFSLPVSRNAPFKGGHIVRAHCTQIPWIQLELSRTPFADNAQKKAHLLQALTDLCILSSGVVRPLRQDRFMRRRG